MKNSLSFLIMASILLLICPVWGQMSPGSGGPPLARRRPMLYNPQTLITIRGTVEKVEEVDIGRGLMVREIFVKTPSRSIMVFLAPSSYLDQQKFAIQTGEAVEIIGSRVTLRNHPAIIARDITVNGKTLKLRNDQGLPAWHRKGRDPGRGVGPQGSPPKSLNIKNG